jgi:3-oxoacyl-[acyl-carrier-protein] synthase-3
MGYREQISYDLSEYVGITNTEDPTPSIYYSKDYSNTCVLFGDGAGAVVIEAVEDNEDGGIINTHIEADGSQREILRTNVGPADKNTPLNIIMNGQAVFKHAIDKMSSSIEKLLKESNITKDDIQFIIPHQANLRILEGVAHRLEMPQEKFIATVDKHANTSAASIPLALYEALKEGKIKKNDLIVFEAIGGGLAWGGVLLRW